jgi:hypothetical protein
VRQLGMDWFPDLVSILWNSVYGRKYFRQIFILNFFPKITVRIFCLNSSIKWQLKTINSKFC